jgi:hypothetical protein
VDSENAWRRFNRHHIAPFGAGTACIGAPVDNRPIERTVGWLNPDRRDENADRDQALQRDEYERARRKKAIAATGNGVSRM